MVNEKLETFERRPSSPLQKKKKVVSRNIAPMFKPCSKVKSTAEASSSQLTVVSSDSGTGSTSESDFE